MRVGNCTEILPGVAAGTHTNGVIKRPMFVHPPQLTVAGHVVHSSVGKLASSALAIMMPGPEDQAA